MCLISNLRYPKSAYVFVLSIESWHNSMVDVKGIRLDGSDFNMRVSKTFVYNNTQIMNIELRHIYRDMIEAVFVRRTNE